MWKLETLVISFSVLFHLGHVDALSFEGRSHMVNGCKIHSLAGEPIKVLPGDLCVFLDSGDFISLTQSKLRYLKKTGEVLWQDTNPFFHHQINLSADKKRLLVLGSVKKEIDGLSYRVDRMLVYEISTGKLLKKIDSDTILFDKKIKPYVLNNTFPPEIFGTKSEYSHFNSFYEIPTFASTKQVHPEIKAGRYILNSLALGFFILDENLEKVMFYKKIEVADRHYVHDVQVTKKGTILAFVNVIRDSKGSLHSSIMEFDSLTMQSVYEFKSNPASMFFSRFCGGVQEVGVDLIFFSHNYAGVYLLKKTTGEIIFMNDQVFKDGYRIIPSQQIKLENLDAFLEMNSKDNF